MTDILSYLNYPLTLILMSWFNELGTVNVSRFNGVLSGDSMFSYLMSSTSY